MRPFEILSSFAALLAIGSSLLALRWRSRSWWTLSAPYLAAISIVSASVQIWIEGSHWQLWPLYSANLILLAFLFFPLRRSGVQLALTVFATLLVIATAGLSWFMPMFRLPKPTGSYNVGTRLLYLVDEHRAEVNGSTPSGKRELMVQVWYPAALNSERKGSDAYYQRRDETTFRGSYRSVLKTNSVQNASLAPGGPFPLLIYSPSWMGERTEGTFQMEELASHGFVVVALDHTFFGGRVAFPDGRVVDSKGMPEIGNFVRYSIAQQWDLGGKYVRIEAEDNSFVLDELEKLNRDSASMWSGALDLSRIGAMGFSIGGSAAVQMAIDDPRVKAVLDMDGWIFGDFGQRGLGQPLMIIYEDKAHTVPAPDRLVSGSSAQQRDAQFSRQDFDHVVADMSKNGGEILFLAGSRHVNFTDRSLLSPVQSVTGRGPIDPRRAHAIVNSYTLAFFSHFLNGVEEPLLRGDKSPFQEVEVENFNGGPN